MSNDHLGPKMLALNPRQRAFVEAYIGNGGKQGAAAEQAGYGSPSVTASRMMATEKIKAAITEVNKSRTVAHGLQAVTTMIGILKNPKHKDQFKAAAHLMAVAGVGPKNGHETTSLREQLAAAIERFKAVCGPENLMEETQ